MLVFFPHREVVLTVGTVTIYWYGLLYVVAFLLALILLPRLGKWRGLNVSRNQWIEIVVWVAAGVLIGGRVGYALFYEPTYFVNNPQHLLQLWRGGMSSHGGFIGAGVGLMCASRATHVNFWRLVDVVVVPAALGLALGRFGNFINHELYGTLTTHPWGVTVPGLEGLRHPVQIYGAAKDIFLAGLCYWYLRSYASAPPGKVTGLFLMGYAISRSLVEIVRVQEYPMLALGPVHLSRGQLLCIPLFLVGGWLWKQMPRARNHKSQITNSKQISITKSSNP